MAFCLNRSHRTFRVGAQPLARLCRVGHVHLDESQYVPIQDAFVPPEPLWRITAKEEERAAAELPRQFVSSLKELLILDGCSMTRGVWVVEHREPEEYGEPTRSSIAHRPSLRPRAP